jgi:DNA modification methylase
VVPFAGSGSECVAAKIENINFIGYEINEEYIELCAERLAAL